MGTNSVKLVPSVGRQKFPRRTTEQQQRLWGWLFLSPWLIGFVAFTAFPMIASLVFSFTDFSIRNQTHFVGFDNWKKLLSDPQTLNSIAVTFRFGIFLIPVSVLFPLLLATLLNAKSLPGKPLFRTLFYMPYFVPALSTVMIWRS